MANNASNAGAILSRLMTSYCTNTLTDESELQCIISFWIVRICPYLWLTFGTIGNVLNIILLSRKRLRKQSTSIYLLFLAGSDLILLWVTMLRNIMLRGQNVDIKAASVFNCTVHEFIAYSTAIFSVWLLVLVTFERMIFTKFPMFAKFRMTRKYALIMVFITLVTILLSCSHMLFGERLLDSDSDSAYIRENSLPTSGSVKCIFKTEEYMIFFQSTWAPMFLFIANVIPFLLLVISNVLIIVTLRLNRRRVNPDGSVTGRVTSNERRNLAITRMLMIVCLYFVLSMTPYSVFVVVIGRVPKEVFENNFPTFVLLCVATFYIALSNYMLNFFFYFVCGTHFKREWNDLLCEIRRKLPPMLRRRRSEVSVNVTRASASTGLGQTLHTFTGPTPVG